MKTGVLNASAIFFFFQGYRKVIVTEGQVSLENYGSDSSPRTISFMKEGKYLYVYAGLGLDDSRIYTPAKDVIYHLNGFEIVVSEVQSDWFILFVKPEWT